MYLFPAMLETIYVTDLVDSKVFRWCGHSEQLYQLIHVIDNLGLLLQWLNLKHTGAYATQCQPVSNI